MAEHQPKEEISCHTCFYCAVREGYCTHASLSLRDVDDGDGLFARGGSCDFYHKREEEKKEQHPYYAKSDYPPYKLRETIKWAWLLIPPLGIAYGIYKLAEKVRGE